MKKIILISALLLVGCSQEQDTRLLCNLSHSVDGTILTFRWSSLPDEKLYWQIDTDDSEFIFDEMNQKRDLPLIFNQSQKKLRWRGYLQNKKWIAFGKDIIEYAQDGNINLETGGDSGHSVLPYEKLSFDRASLKLTEYIIPVTQVDLPTKRLTNTENPIRVNNYLCRVVDGV